MPLIFNRYPYALDFTFVMEIKFKTKCPFLTVQQNEEESFLIVGEQMMAETPIIARRVLKGPKAKYGAFIWP